MISVITDQIDDLKLSEMYSIIYDFIGTDYYRMSYLSTLISYLQIETDREKNQGHKLSHISSDFVGKSLKR